MSEDKAQRHALTNESHLTTHAQNEIYLEKFLKL